MEANSFYGMVARATDGYEMRDEGLTSIEYGQGPMDDRTPLAKATPKSLRTRARILESAMQLFVDIGYHAATNAVIADAAHLTRGAMLYHFATREDLVEAVIEHIELQRARLFEKAASAPTAPGVDAAEHAIDVYWSMLHEAPFQAFAELEAASRTDAMLRERLAGARSEFDRAQLGGDRFGALVQAGVDPRFQTSRDLGRFLLEGLAKGSMTYDETARRERLLTVVKRAVRMLNRKGDLQDLWTN